MAEGVIPLELAEVEGNAVTVWSSILKVAFKRGCLADLVARAAEHYPRQRVALLAAQAAYEAAMSQVLDGMRGSRGENRGARRASSWTPKLPEIETVPPLPHENYVERPEALATIRSAVLSHRGSRIALTAFEGMGGIGKTELAKALCLDAQIRREFTGGILWLSIGKESIQSPQARLRAVANALGAPSGDYRNVLRDKAVLLVLDDVWDADDLEPFRVLSAQSCLLFTTRDASIAASIGASQVSAELLTSDSAIKMFGRYAKIGGKRLPGVAKDIVEECGRLPLVLAMVGALLRGKPESFWHTTLYRLRRGDFSSLGVSIPGYRHKNLFAVVQASVEDLEPPMRTRYGILAVLLEDMALPLPIQRALWSVDASEAIETAELLVEKSLAQRDVRGHSIRLHDLQLAYLRSTYADQGALQAIHDGIRLSAHAITNDPLQFCGQLIGRLDTRIVVGLVDFVRLLRLSAPRPCCLPRSASLIRPGSGLIRTLSGHAGWVCCLAVTQDGRRVISGSDDYTLVLWDIESGRQLRRFVGHSYVIYSVAIVGGGKRAVSASGDGTLKLWDLEAGGEVRTLAGHSGQVIAVAVDKSGWHAASVADDGAVKLWDLRTGEQLREVRGGSDINDLAVTDDFRRAVVVGSDGTVNVLNLDSGRVICSFDSGEWQHAVDITPDGRLAVSGSEEGTLAVWDLRTKRRLWHAQAHAEPIAAVTITPQQDRVISASNDETLKIWDLASGRLENTLRGHGNWVESVTVTPDGKRALSGSADYTVNVWDISVRSDSLVEPAGQITGIAGSDRSGLCVSSSWDGRLFVWDVKEAKSLRTLEGHAKPVTRVWVTSDGRRAISASHDDTLKVWDLETGKLIQTRDTSPSTVSAVAIAKDGQTAISACTEKIIEWNLEDGRPLRHWEGRGYVSDLRIETGKVSGFVTAGDHVAFVDLSVDEPVKVLFVENNETDAVARTPDGRLAFVPSDENVVHIWDLVTGRRRGKLSGHTHTIWDIAISKDGRHVATASEDKTVRIWDSATRKCRCVFTCDSGVTCCSWVGDVVIAGDNLGRVHFLEFKE